jgi:hypothetical protein
LLLLLLLLHILLHLTLQIPIRGTILQRHRRTRPTFPSRLPLQRANRPQDRQCRLLHRIIIDASQQQIRDAEKHVGFDADGFAELQKEDDFVDGEFGTLLEEVALDFGVHASRELAEDVAWS